MTTTNVFTVNNTAWTDLGAGPLEIQSLTVPVSIIVSDTTPASNAVGFQLNYDADVLGLNVSSHVWAKSLSSASGSIICTPMTVTAGGTTTVDTSTLAKDTTVQSTNSLIGAGGTGISQPSGGTGLLGYLSGSYNKLVNGVLSVSGTVSATQSGSWNVSISNFPATQSVSGTVAATQNGSWTTSVTGSVAVTGTFYPSFQPVSGDVAAGSTDSGNPIKFGGIAHTSNSSVVTDGQRVNALFDKSGRLVSIGSLRESRARQFTTISTTTETTVITAAGANVFNDIYGLTIANTSSGTVTVTFRDATAGSIALVYVIPANATSGFMLPVDSAVKQSTAANNWTATLSAGSVAITANYVSIL